MLQFTWHVMVSALLGALIGLERQYQQGRVGRALAGLRTNALVATGAAAFVALSVLTAHDTSPTRIAAQVVSGVGFLGGGAILKSGLNVRGLTTAATIWCSAAVGVLAGTGFVAESVLTTLIVVCTNVLLRPLSHRIGSHPVSPETDAGEALYRVAIVCREDDALAIRVLAGQMAQAEQLVWKSFSETRRGGETEIAVTLSASGGADSSMERLTARLSLEPAVRGLSWRLESAPGDVDLG